MSVGFGCKASLMVWVGGAFSVLCQGGNTRAVGRGPEGSGVVGCRPGPSGSVPHRSHSAYVAIKIKIN